MLGRGGGAALALYARVNRAKRKRAGAGARQVATKSAPGSRRGISPKQDTATAASAAVPAKPRSGPAGRRAAKPKPVHLRVAGGPGQKSKVPIKLSLRQQRAAEAYVGPAQGQKTAACRQAGYEETTAEHQASRVIGLPAVQAEIGRLLELKGLTDEVVVEKHRALLDARFTRFFKDEVVADCEHNDVQLKAVELYYQLTGRLKHRVEIEGEVQHVVECLVQSVHRHVSDRAVVAAIIDEVVAGLQASARN